MTKFPAGRSRALTSPASGRRHWWSAPLAVAAGTAVFVGALPGVAAAATSPTLPYGLGATLPTDFVPAGGGVVQLSETTRLAGGALRAAATLPPSVDLTAFAVPAGNQGSHGACVSFTTAYTLSGWLSNYSRHVGAPFAPMYVYNQVNGGSDSRGTTFGGNFAILEDQGTAEAASWTHPFSDYLSKPTAAELANAALHKLTPHTRLFAGPNQGSAAQTAIQTALANNQPVALGIPVFSPFFALNATNSTFTLANATGSIVGYHAVGILGYNQTGVLIENSWTSSWGNRGFATLGWDFINTYAFEADAMGTFAAGANGLKPLVSGLSAPAVNALGGANLTFTASRLYSVDLTRPGAVRLVSVADPSVSVPVRVVGSTATTVTVTVPAMPADGQYRVVVTGSGGASLPNAVADVVTAVHPFSIALGDSQVGRSDTTTPVVVTGSGFGTTATGYSAAKVTATVAGKAAAVTYVDDTHVKVSVPPAPAGSTAQVVVNRYEVPSNAVTVGYLPPLPVVSSVTPARTDVAGGASITVGLRNLTSGQDTRTVTLVSLTDSTVRARAPITARTTTSLTFAAPAAPHGAEGNFHVIVTGAGGSSLAVAADVLGYRTPLTGSVPSGLVSPVGGGTVTVSGSGFGSTSTAFAAKAITATVAGAPAAVRWGSDNALVVTLPVGIPGAAAPIVLLRDTVPGQPVTGLTYGAAVSRISTLAGPRAGWVTYAIGAGFTRSGGWALVDSTGRTVASLPVVTTSTALSAATGGGVLVSSPTMVMVRLPAAAAGRYRLTFVPDQGSYPGAVLIPTDQSLVTYSAT